MALSNQDSDPFAAIASENGRIIFGEVLSPGAIEDGEEIKRRITTDKLKEWYSSEKMHRHIVALLGWQGRKKDYKSLQIDPSDEDFRAACGVLHKRLAGSAFAFLLKYLGNEAVEDVIVCFVGFSPVAAGFIEEAVEKAEAEQRQRQRQKAPVSDSDGDKTDGQ